VLGAGEVSAGAFGVVIFCLLTDTFDGCERADQASRLT
jgi:hypothetical protein